MDILQKKFHKSRREKLLNILDDNSLVIVTSNTNVPRSFDDIYKFKQNKNFYYLTGFNEPDSVLMMCPSGIEFYDGNTKKVVKTTELLFVQKKDPLKETWTGRRLGYDKVNSVLGINRALVNTKFSEILADFLSKDKVNKIYIPLYDIFNLKGLLKEQFYSFTSNWITSNANIQVLDITYTLAKMRNVKKQFEIEQIRYAVNATAASFKTAIKTIRPGIFEYNVQSMLEYGYKHFGSSDVAFETICASGNNACILHYNTNRDKIKSGDLLLIDSGAEFGYYNGDLTRTIPVNGKFTKEQAQIYSIVLETQKAVIKKIKPGAKLSELKAYSVSLLEKGMKKLNLLKKGYNITKYSLHGVGHHIGLDTHDAVANKKIGKADYDTLLVGNVLTVEPGLYLPEDAKEIPERYRRIGVRIEDDVLVTKEGCEVLSDSLPKEIKDIEELMK